MSYPEDITLGPLTRQIIEDSALSGKDDFPSSQECSDEVEAILRFIESHGEFDRFLPRLRSRNRQSCYAEIVAAYFFAQIGFDILTWEPISPPYKPGEIEVRWKDANPIFIEVKCPDWTGELTKSERNKGRKLQPKHINGDCRWVDPTDKVEFEVSKALPKFDPDKVNLLVIVDDLFTSVLDWPLHIATCRLQKYLDSDSEFAKVSGLFVLKQEFWADNKPLYRGLIVKGPGIPLPDEVVQILSDQKWTASSFRKC